MGTGDEKRIGEVPTSGGGPIHARVPIHAQPLFS